MSLKTARWAPVKTRQRPYADDAAVPAHQGAASRQAAVLPHGRFLRAVLRRCRAGRAAARHHAHAARRVRRRADQDGRRALPRGRAISRQAGQARRIGRDLRADRRPEHLQGSGRAPGHAHRHAGHADRCGAAGRQARQLAARRSHRTGTLLGHRVAVAGSGRFAVEETRAATISPPNSSGCSRRKSCCRDDFSDAGAQRHRHRGEAPAAWQFDRDAAIARSDPAVRDPRPVGLRRRRTRPGARRRRRAARIRARHPGHVDRPRPCAVGRTRFRSTCAWTRRRGATSRSPKPCAANRRRRCCRCSTPAPPAWAARWLRHALHHPLRDRAGRRGAAGRGRDAARARAATGLAAALRAGAAARWPTSSASPRASRCAMRGRATRRACAIRCSCFRRCSSLLAPLSSPRLAALADRSRTAAGACRPARARDPAGTRGGAARRRRDRRRLSTPSSTNCARSRTTAANSCSSWKHASATRTGIANLKVEYNRVHGFYIEVTHAQRRKGAGRLPPPPDAEERRALHHAGAEDLRGQGAVGAGARARARKAAVRQAARRAWRRHLPRCSGWPRRWPSWMCWPHLPSARRRSITRAPEFTDEEAIEIEAGRHPVVEEQIDELHRQRHCAVDPARRLLLITGPNMGGKSTYMRQAALIVLLAHAARFVPAKRALIGPVDRDLHPHRRRRRSCRRPLDLHGGNDRGGQHPAQRHAHRAWC